MHVTLSHVKKLSSVPCSRTHPAIPKHTTAVVSRTLLGAGHSRFLVTLRDSHTINSSEGATDNQSFRNFLKIVVPSFLEQSTALGFAGDEGNWPNPSPPLCKYAPAPPLSEAQLVCCSHIDPELANPESGGTGAGAAGHPPCKGSISTITTQPMHVRKAGAYVMQSFK